MRSYRPALITLCIGLLTFVGVFAFLQMSQSPPATDPAVVEPTAAPARTGPSSDSLTVGIAAGQVAVGVPGGEADPLLQAARSGDRLDVLASLPAPTDGRPVTGVVVSGAMVLRPATLTDPLLLQVSGPDAMVLAHLVLGGTRLSYTVRPAGAGPAGQAPLDERTARARLELPPLVTTPVAQPRAPEPAPTRVPAPSPSPTTTSRPATYTAQEGESLYTVATRLGVDPSALWWANRSLIDPTVPLVAGTTLVVPVFSGFLYQVQVGDTWDSVATLFSVPLANLRARNELPDDASLVSGMLLFIPRDP